MTICGSESALSIASGINPNKAAVSKVPVAYDIKRGTSIFWVFSPEMTKLAAAVMAPILPKILNKTIQMRILYSHLFLN